MKTHTLWVKYESLDSEGWMPKKDGQFDELEALGKRLMDLPNRLFSRFIDVKITKYGDHPEG